MKVIPSFDTKETEGPVAIQVETARSCLARVKRMLRSLMRRPLDAVIGFGFLPLTLFGSVRFLSTASDYLATGLFWVGHNAFGTGVYVASAFNMMSRRPRDNLTKIAMQLSLDSPRYIIGAFLEQHNYIFFPVSSSRLIPYDYLTINEAAIDGLRSCSEISAFQLYSHFCWVDFEQRWSVAHTAERAAIVNALGMDASGPSKRSLTCRDGRPQQSTRCSGVSITTFGRLKKAVRGSLVAVWCGRAPTSMTRDRMLSRWSNT